jgi:hypothetical protein
MTIGHPVVRWWFDETVGWFGQWVENMLAETEEVKTKEGTKHVPKYRIEPLLGLPTPTRKINPEHFGFPRRN